MSFSKFPAAVFHWSSEWWSLNGEILIKEQKNANQMRDSVVRDLQKKDLDAQE